MAGSRKNKTDAAPDFEAIAARARALIDANGAVKLNALGPKRIHAEIAERLRRDGHEVTKVYARRPLGEQLVQALSAGAFVPLKSVQAHVHGATSAEAKKAALEAVRNGAIRRVLRTQAETLVGPNAAVLTREQLGALKSVVNLSKAADKALRQKVPLSLLRDDVLQALEELIADLRRTDKVPAQSKLDLSQLLLAVEQERDPALGMSFVPAVIHALGPGVVVSEALALLLSAARDGMIELRPEGGLDRLTPEESALCPPGPHGTKLSWARRAASEGTP